jgi:DNA-directed RNA polymerase subunit omega
MMVKPTTAELLEKTDSKFRLVIATAKRARQIAEGSPKLINIDEESPVTIAANEISEEKVTIINND